MITLEATHPTTREAGVVYTKPWMVELVLDLDGYLPEKPLAQLVALEHLAVSETVLVTSCSRIPTSSSALNCKPEHTFKISQ